ncbi:uncharacterized protein Z518_00612 [Rhinocladiella mackenziei CBS 650.93]|uniref:Uncharacterized protein n=1 Tax=Rhinocladiella mackenziei CBS 650.93 TaxID=1442369 RepID=A0A0D2G4F0_9EURO|nr:uncharacterized protein Z518_00612 [Rhinocladiella mackenziei CBS 650.93]KIX09532.1 hypothetical protein Z518_00612 [Rhinocladiella mackenziei CBS 650.93]
MIKAPSWTFRWRRHLFFLPTPPPPPAPGLVGTTWYNYFTRDGGPNKGAPPGGPSTSVRLGLPPPYSSLPPLLPTYRPPISFMVPAPSFPGAWTVSTVIRPSLDSPTTPAMAHAAAQAPEPPIRGNQVKDRLIVVKDRGGTGYVASQKNATIHLFTHNVLDKYAVNANNQFYIPAHACEPFRVVTAACSMPVGELIEQLDCIKDAPPGYLRYAIGNECGRGW